MDPSVYMPVEGIQFFLTSVCCPFETDLYQVQSGKQILVHYGAL